MNRLLPFLAVALVANGAAAASISERTRYFNVRGSTLTELDRELTRKGPVAGPLGQRHPGATQVAFGGRVTYRPASDGCRVGGTQFTLKLVKFLPRWRQPRGATRTTAIVWQTLEQDIARHEEDHARIARNYAKRMETAVRNLGSRRTCAVLETAVNATTARYLKEHEREQLAFDAKEGREVNRRLQRLLKANMAKAREAAAATQ